MQTIWRPKDISEAWSIQNNLAEEYTYVSGGTWLRTQWEADLLPMSPHLISLESLNETKGINETSLNGETMVFIGASTTLASCITDPVVNTKVPLLAKACKNIAAPSIRNQATLGGNISIATGDTLPALLVYDSYLKWFNGTNYEYERLEDWLVSPLQNHRRILVAIMIPVTQTTQEGDFCFYTKIGRRETFTASVVTVAGVGERTKDGIFQHIKLAAGGGASRTMKLALAAAKIENQPYSQQLLEQVNQTIAEEVIVKSDPFASSAYKKGVIANLISSEFYHLAQSKGGDPLAPRQES
ncbi:FAD binding domain-containing protein [Bacillus suaedae]|uniref:FAD binding domain-containing protein n=1 Tax=Halalkalibacter suaedae TaxID=2822140 RepID=A0A940X087_9BACI|nr:FAD binding domain-containing protein [Bacillus suaedae]MBP3952455.1 FAD binding domain-containing protein [Bacillus suaedae]